MKAVITGGGTGGHIYPALTIADQFKKKNWEVEYIGCKDSLEEEILKNTDYPFHQVKVLALPRKLNLELFKSIFISIQAIIKSYKLFKDIQPDIVFGTGGYVTGPVLIAAKLRKLPAVIHEQNIYPGIANKILSFFVDKIAVNNKEATRYFSNISKDKIVETGNPIREEIIKTTRAEGIKKLDLNHAYKTLFLMGGSQGSRTINQAFLESLKDIIQLKKLQVILITGRDNYQKIKNQVNQKMNEDNNRLRIIPYLDNIEWAYAAADLIICRAGATGLAEITARGIPSILIPFPYSAEDHQRVNARFMEENKAAVMVKDSEFNGETLYNYVKEILFDQDKLKEMKKNSQSLARLNAVKDIVEIIESQVREESS
ncbi:MAG: undecaprenyldiphospho-muramoylpentapeptide beta-N-acetylglucosaminyltransferase [Halanaerobiales bacterium]|nr:undecaprenyldiphospho-muramoylpentapeptide beta-N-acetylglucosaminyltransferase [Halanaerobiales bacterium]